MKRRFQVVGTNVIQVMGRVTGLALVGLFMAAAANAADIPADSLKLAPDVKTAAEGYETNNTDYIVANPTDLYSDHYIYGTKVTGSVARGMHVMPLAKVKGYDWVLGRDGVGIGYASISMLAPADKYIP